MGDAPPESGRYVLELETNLHRAAVEGQRLLAENNTLEGAHRDLEERLAVADKRNSSLQRRFELTVANLEQAETSNRALLVSQENDRRTIARLSIDAARYLSSATELKASTRAAEDTRQELVAERKRATMAETRVKKQGERVVEMEERLQRAIQDLEEMRQDKVLRSRKSQDALAQVKDRFQRTITLGGPALASINDHPEASELMKLIGALVSENEMLRSSSVELHELLDVSREEQSGLRSEIENRQAFLEEDEDAAAKQFHAKRNHSLGSETLLSPAASRSSSDLSGRPSSPNSTAPNSFARSWAPSASASQNGDSSRRLSSGSTDEHSRLLLLAASTSSARLARRRAAAPSNVIPIGRGHNRRAASVDLKSINRYGNVESDGMGSAPASPMVDERSPPSRSPSTFGDTDDSGRRRPPRPLSLSLGPSLFPFGSEGYRSPSLGYPRAAGRGTSPIAISFAPVDDPATPAPSGLSRSSPTKRARRPSTPEPSISVATVESATQTSPHPISIFDNYHPTTSTPTRASPHGFDESISRSAASTADLSERERTLLDFGLPAGSHDLRTAVLGTLIEHTTKLFARIQGADIATQEKRLKKQNLLGDVRFLAQANLKDLLSEIEGLRHHFRRVLEQERSSAAKDATGSLHSDTESLVARRDFVALVKLFRDLLFEISRLRSLVNRVQLEPSLAVNLRSLDVSTSFEVELSKPGQASLGAGLLAPLSRLFNAALLIPEPDVTPRSPASLRPPPRGISKLSGSSVVSSATVNVEFGKGHSRAVAKGGEREDVTSPEASNAGSSPYANSATASKTGTQVRRDLNSIFAGGIQPKALVDPWVVVPAAAKASRGFTSNPLGRLLASYRPAMSSTTNAVLDSIPHAPQVDGEYQPTLLERTLRPRGLSDSSIRSTFVAHANPHHRIISAATLASSTETSAASEQKPVLSNQTDEQSRANFRSLGEFHAGASLSRKSSQVALRSKLSHPQLSTIIPPVPALPIPPVPSLPISISPPLVKSGLPTPQPVPIAVLSTTLPSHLAPPSQASILLTNLSSWAGKLSPLAIAVESESAKEGAHR